MIKYVPAFFVCLLVATSVSGQDMDALVADVLTFIGSLLKLIGDLVDQGKPMLSGGRSQQQQQQQQISYKDTSSDTTSDTSTKLQPCSTNANCTGFKNGTATTKFTDCGICSSCASEDAQEENDRQCLAACLYYRKGNVTPSDTGCKKLPDNVTTCIDDCTCIENLYLMSMGDVSFDTAHALLSTVKVPITFARPLVGGLAGETGPV